MSDKVKMIADAKLRQDGEWIRAGQPFTCSEADAADLKAMGMAHRDPKAEPARQSYRRRDMTAQ